METTKGEPTVQERLIRAQSQMKNPLGGAMLGDILDVVIPALNSNGLFLTQILIDDGVGKDPRYWVRTIIYSDQEEYRKLGTVPVVSLSEHMPDQTFAEQVCGARRLGILMAFGLSPAYPKETDAPHTEKDNRTQNDG